MKKKRYLSFSESINEAQIQAMRLDKNVFIFGLGVEKTGHVFKTTTGIKKKFSSKRIFESPNSEMALTLFAAGAANKGLRPILIHHRVDFMAYTFDQLVNWISLWSFKSAGMSSMPLVIRAIIGKGWGQGPQHAKTLHSMFSYLPGLITVMPSSPSEAKGLLLSSIMSNDPVIFLEYRELYNTREHVPEKPYFIKLDEVRHRLKGNDITIVAMGPSVLKSIKAQNICGNKIKFDLFDLRSISKFNLNKIYDSLKKTKRLICVEDGWKEGSISSEIISKVAEEGIKLKKPPVKITWPSSHVPMSYNLEKDFYFDENEIVKSAEKMLNKKV